MFGIFFTYILDNDGKYVRNFAVIFGKPVINHPQVIARFIRKYPQLAGGFSPPLVSLDDENPNIQKKKNMFQTTNRQGPGGYVCNIIPRSM